jgi:hypothetical protein
VVLEVVVGSLFLLFGRLCFGHVSRVRALYSYERPTDSRFYGGKPPLVAPAALGALLTLCGLALLALGAVRLFSAGG